MDKSTANVWDRLKRKVITVVGIFFIVIGSLLNITLSSLLAFKSENITNSVPKLTVQKGHVEDVHSVVFNPNGRILASGSWDSTIKLWRVPDGQLIRTLEGNKHGVDSVVFSPDGNLLVSVSFGEIKLWQVSDGKLLKTIKDEWRFRSASFSPDGSILASGSSDNTIKLWQVSDGKLIRTLEGHSRDVNSVAFSPDGSILASGSWDKTIKLWQVSDGKLIRTLEGHKREVNSVAFSPDGNILASGGGDILTLENSDYTIKLWQVSDGKLIRTLEGHKREVNSVAFSPDGSILASGSFDNTIKLWQVSDGKLIRTLIHSEPMSVSFSSDNKLLASGSSDKTIKLWRVSDGQLVKTLKSNVSSVNSVVFSPDAKIIASGGSFEYILGSEDADNIPNFGNIYLWRLSDGRLIKTLEDKVVIDFVSFSSNENFLATANSNGIIKIWDISEDHPLRIIDWYEYYDGSLVLQKKFNDFRPIKKGDYHISSIVFSHDGLLLASGGYVDNMFTLIMPRSLPISKIGTISLWRVSDASLRPLEGHDKEVNSVSFSPDDKLLASGSFDNTIKLWRVSDGKLIRTLEGHKSEVNSVAFSPDGSILASGSSDNTIKLWRVSDGKLIRTLEGHKGEVNSVAFSPDGSILASGCFDNTIKLWQVSDGKLIRTLEGHNSSVVSVVFSPNGKLLTSGSWDNSIKIWQPETGNLLATLFAFNARTSLVVIPEGFFSGTGDFNKYVHFVKGLEVYDFNQFYDAFYRPDLVQEKLRGEDISKKSGGLRIEDSIKTPPPQVSILLPKEGDSVSARTVTVKVQIKDTGGGIGDIRIHHNGKLVDSLGVYRLAKPETEDKQIKLAKADIENPYQTARRGIALRKVIQDEKTKEIKTVDFIPQEGTIEKTHTVTLIRGENTISVSAFNGTNTVMSAMESIRINADVPERKPELFVISVGNNNFANTSYNLRMPVKDSKDFSDIIQKVAAPIYEKVNIKTLTDANKKSLIEAITSIALQMKPEDIFIFFSATHGRTEDDIYYIYTSEFDGNIRKPEGFISSVEMMEFSKRIPALKQVFIFDTCQAGGVEMVITKLYDTRISVLAKALGMHIFAGAKTYQEALDEYKGNGLFTHFVLNGLKGEADGDKNREVTVFEMNPYLTRTVKEASKGTQDPFIRNFGDNLPLSNVTGK